MQRWFIKQRTRLKAEFYNLKSISFWWKTPIAQDIFAVYGRDNYGVMGCYTLPVSTEMDGIMMKLIKGLEKRTAGQKKQIQELQQQNEQLLTRD